jgi:GTP-binding protein YchF
MKLGLIGLPGSGKKTIFEALTSHFLDTGQKGENRIGTVRVPDQRVDDLSKIYAPKKTTYAQVEYLLPGRDQDKDRSKTSTAWNAVRDCDALIHVVRNFSGYGLSEPMALKDVGCIDEELILADLIVVEKRMERLALDKKRGKAPLPEEGQLLESCLEILEGNASLRQHPDVAFAQPLKGFAFLSAKPMLILFNNDDEDDSLPPIRTGIENEFSLVIRGKIEQEMAQMSADEAEAFLTEFNIPASAKDRVIKKSYELLGLISFFTVGEDEVKAWTIRKGTTAIDAAEVIHSDMKKGFIRGEVLAYDDLMSAGSYAAARKKGTVRLEGKDYEVQDGDILHVRFNV